MPRHTANKRTSDSELAAAASSKRRSTAHTAAEADTTTVVNEHLKHQAGGVNLEENAQALQDADGAAQAALKTPDKTAGQSGRDTPDPAGSASSSASASRLVPLPDTSSGRSSYKVVGPTELVVVTSLQSKVDDKNFTYLTGSVKDTVSGE